MKAGKYLVLLSVLVGAGLLAGTPVAYAHHGDREYHLLRNGADDSGQFTVKGTDTHSIVKAKNPVHYRICTHHHGGTITIIHDGQSTPMLGGNCTDLEASNIDVKGTDANGSASGDFAYLERNHHHHHQ